MTLKGLTVYFHILLLYRKESGRNDALVNKEAMLSEVGKGSRYIAGVERS